MGMPVVNIWSMRVVVASDVVLVPMGMLTGRYRTQHERLVIMSMMYIIMPVAVIMFQHDVLMRVFMIFRDQQKCSQQHQRERN